jgi:hypothetical protein
MTMSTTNTETMTNTMTTTKAPTITVRPDTVCVSVSATAWSRIRTINHTALADALVAQRDTELIQGRVCIARSATIDKIESLLRNTRANALMYAVRAPTLRLYLAKEGVVPRIQGIVQQGLDELQALLQQLAEEWPAIVDSAKAPIQNGGLGELFRPEWYPTKDEIVTSYGLRMDVIKVTMTTDVLEKVAKEARDELRSAFVALVQGLIERLETGQRLRSDTFDALRQFVATFNARDVVGDSELATLVNQAKAALQIVPAKVSGKDVDMRTTVAGLLKAVEQQAVSLVTPERSFGSDDE